MTDGNQKPDGNSGEQVTVTDKRRIDPETGECGTSLPATCREGRLRPMRRTPKTRSPS